jgi:hypothetical protein
MLSASHSHIMVITASLAPIFQLENDALAIASLIRTSRQRGGTIKPEHPQRERADLFKFSSGRLPGAVTSS